MCVHIYIYTHIHTPAQHTTAPRFYRLRSDCLACVCSACVCVPHVVTARSFVLDLTMLESMLSCRSFTHSDLTPLVSDCAHVASLLPVRSSSQPKLPLSMTDSTHSGAIITSQGVSRLGLRVLSFGLARTSSVFFLSTLDMAHLGPLLFLRLFSWSNAAPAVISEAHIESALSSRFHAYLGCSLLVFGFNSFGLSLATREHAQLNVASFSKNLIQLGFTLLASDFLQLGLPSPLRLFTYLKFNSASFGLARSGIILSWLTCHCSERLCY